MVKSTPFFDTRPSLGAQDISPNLGKICLFVFVCADPKSQPDCKLHQKIQLQPPPSLWENVFVEPHENKQKNDPKQKKLPQLLIGHRKIQIRLSVLRQ